MTEEELQQRLEKMKARLQETKKKGDIAFAKIEGRMEGMRSGKLDETQRRFIDIIELITAGQKESRWFTIDTTKFIIRFIKFMISTEKSITNLEKEVKEIRETLDKLSEWK